MTDQPPKTVEEAIKLIRETREAIARADRLLSDLASKPPSVLSSMAEPTWMMREGLLAELAKLEEIKSNL